MTGVAEQPTTGKPAAEPAPAQDAPAGNQQTSAADQPPAGKPGKGGEAAPSPKPDVPVEYKWKAPEGRQFHSETIKGYEAIVRDLKVAPDVAQSLLDRVVPLLEGRQSQQVKELRDGWRKGLESDPEIGGSRLEETRQLAAKTIESLGTPELRELIEQTGIGEHKAFAALLRRVGEALSEDRFVAGRKAAGDGPLQPRTRPQVAQRWYGAGDAKAKTQ